MIIAVLGVEFHPLIKPTNLLPSITTDQKERKIRMIFKWHVRWSELLNLGGIIRGDPGDKGQLVGQEKTVGPRGEHGVIVRNKDMLCHASINHLKCHS